MPQAFRPSEMLVAKLHRQRKQRAHGEIDVLFGCVAAEAAEQVILGNAELRVLAHLLAQMRRARRRNATGPLANCRHRPSARRPAIDMVLDHPLEGPGLRPRLQAQRRIEIETVFGFEMRANEGGSAIVSASSTM